MPVVTVRFQRYRAEPAMSVDCDSKTMKGYFQFNRYQKKVKKGLNHFMKEEIRDPKNKKIVPFLQEGEPDDITELDDLIKESLIQEADELEAQLNADPRLKGAAVSDELFSSIVDQLKEQGDWEEETEEQEADPIEKIGGEEKTAQSGLMKQDAVRAEKQEMQSVQNSIDIDSSNEMATNREREVEQVSIAGSDVADGKAQNRVVELSEEKGKIVDGKHQENLEKKGFKRTHKFGRKAKQKETVAEIEIENEMKQEDSSADAKSLEELYAMLPEEDRRAMELGRQAEQEKRRKAQKKKKRRKIYRNGGIVAATLALVFTVSMSTDASRRLILNAWDVVTYNFNFQVRTNYAEDGYQVRSKSKEEVEAIGEICKRLGVPSIDLEELPKGMDYQSYDIQDDNMEATLFYSYKENVFTVTIINIALEGAAYYMMDEAAEFQGTVITDQEFEVKLWKTNQNKEEDEWVYIAEIAYEDYRYILNGMVSLDEMKNIAKSAFIF
jgi:hypothetical protein